MEPGASVLCGGPISVRISLAPPLPLFRFEPLCASLLAPEASPKWTFESDHRAIFRSCWTCSFKRISWTYACKYSIFELCIYYNLSVHTHVFAHLTTSNWMIYNLNLNACHVDELNSVEHKWMEMLTVAMIMELHSKRSRRVKLADLIIIQYQSFSSSSSS